MKNVPLSKRNEEILTSICDAALKSAGMNMLGIVNELISAIKEEELSEKNL